MFAKKVTSALTLSRLPIGLITAWLLFRGSFSAAFVVFLVGQLTDILDGVIARRFKCESTWGAEWDRRMDMTLHGLTAAGYLLGAICTWGTWSTMRGPINAAAWLLVCLMPTTLLFKPHSAASKLRSGVIRFVLIGYFIERLPRTPLCIALIVVTLIASIPAVILEIKQTIDDVRTGRRRWFKSPRQMPFLSGCTPQECLPKWSRIEASERPIIVDDDALRGILAHLRNFKDADFLAHVQCEYKGNTTYADWRDDRTPEYRDAAVTVDCVECAQDLVDDLDGTRLVISHVISTDGKGFRPSVRFAHDDKTIDGFIELGTGRMAYGLALSAGGHMLDETIRMANERAEAYHG